MAFADENPILISMHIIFVATAATAARVATAANFKKISVKIGIDFLAPDNENLAINVI